MDNATPASAAPAAPAQPAAPATISATLDAANKGDFAAFDKAHVAGRTGAPLADVAVTPGDAPTAPPAAGPETPVSKRQQDINDRIRQAVDAATKDTRAELDRLRAQVGPRAPQPPVTPAAPAAPTVPEWKRFASMPDAPKLADFDSVEEHAAAMAWFVNSTAHAERQAASQQHTHQEQVETAERTRAETFHARLEAARTADPEFVAKLTPEVRSLKPISGLGPDEPKGPLNILWEQVYDSPALDKLLLHFSAKPDELRRFESLPPHIAALPPAVRTRAHIQWIVKEFGALEKSFDASPAAPAPAAAPPSTITAAPPPPPSIPRAGSSSDPQAAAFARNDFAAWDRIETEKARARRGAA